MLALALERKFNKAVGIEIIPELAEVARRNLARYGARCEVSVADAASAPCRVPMRRSYTSSIPRRGMPSRVCWMASDKSLPIHDRRLRVITFGIDRVDVARILRLSGRALAPSLYLFDHCAGQLSERERT